MAIHVKDTVAGGFASGGEYRLFADTKAELTGATLTTANKGPLVCPAGLFAYTGAGEMFILNTAGTWTEVV